ncbi:hypothetical protein GCM10025867_11370 [Frondihabitans sucicola]|uniref:Fluoride ion transporter CrcB n=1 Tax=Frondihabitans sucicola TaxID=1268041 RepID=A0ABM8GKH1_9MICO|nr:hypothetical protein [Frondihabitans sucicola]BDZ48896.1 hypothetical protein GCM10025867_11370 [Frondihabitans sucicola]
MKDHASSFRLGRILVAVFAAGLVSGWGRSLSVRIGDQVDFHVPASLLLPLAAACIITGAVIDPVGPMGATSVRPLRRLAAARVASCTLAFAVGLALGLAAIGAPAADLGVAMRNAGLLLGLSLAAVSVIDLALAWLPSCAYTIICMVAGVGSDGTRVPWAVLLEQDAQATAPWIVSGGVLAVGASSVSTRLRRLQAR